MTADSAQQAVKNARAVSGYATGYCQKYVREQCWRVPSLYGSAIEAWNGARHKHPGDRTPPLGAPCFYKGGQYGHVVIWVGDDDMRSTDCPSSGRVSDADLGWPERAWGDDYLGWAEDLNGIDLPLGDDDEMNSDDWNKLRDIVHDEVEAAWQEHMTLTQPGTGQDTAKARQQVLRELWQKVTKAT